MRPLPRCPCRATCVVRAGPSTATPCAPPPSSLLPGVRPRLARDGSSSSTTWLRGRPAQPGHLIRQGDLERDGTCMLDQAPSDRIRSPAYHSSHAPRVPQSARPGRLPPSWRRSELSASCRACPAARVGAGPGDRLVDVLPARAVTVVFAAPRTTSARAQSHGATPRRTDVRTCPDRSHALFHSSWSYSANHSTVTWRPARIKHTLILYTTPLMWRVQFRAHVKCSVASNYIMVWCGDRHVLVADGVSVSTSVAVASVFR